MHALRDVEDSAADGAGPHLDLRCQVGKSRGEFEQPHPRVVEHLAIADRRPFGLQFRVHVANDGAEGQVGGEAAGEPGRDGKRVGPGVRLVGIHGEEDVPVHRPLRKNGFAAEDEPPRGPSISVISPKARRFRAA